jgi:hypothetical protein
LPLLWGEVGHAEVTDGEASMNAEWVECNGKILHREEGYDAWVAYIKVRITGPDVYLLRLTGTWTPEPELEYSNEYC